jgi:hypothetical protein
MWPFGEAWMQLANFWLNLAALGHDKGRSRSARF